MKSLTLFLLIFIINFNSSVFSQCDPIITPSTGSICTGSSISLTASGASSYSWSPSSGLNNTNSATVIANPIVIKTITISVNPKPTITVNYE